LVPEGSIPIDVIIALVAGEGGKASFGHFDRA
jgi:hypothetical protein